MIIEIKNFHWNGLLISKKFIQNQSINQSINQSLLSHEVLLIFIIMTHNNDTKVTKGMVGSGHIYSMGYGYGARIPTGMNCLSIMTIVIAITITLTITITINITTIITIIILLS